MNTEPDRCIYCGATEPITQDHVPPECLFPDPKPAGLVTVPACQSCNASYGLDDEYFRNLLAAGVAGHPLGDAIWAKTLRSFERRPPIKAAMIRSLTRIERVTPAGVYVGSFVGAKIDFARVERVVIRIVRGLLWHHYRRTPPVDSRFTVRTDQDLMQFPREAIHSLREVFNECSRASIGGTAFEYLHAIPLDEPDASMWWMQFFGRINFMVVLVPPEVAT